MIAQKETGEPIHESRARASRRFRIAGCAVPLFLALGIAGCDSDTEAAEGFQKKVWEPVGERAVPGATTAERFGFRESTPAAPAAAPFLWETPPGWSAMPPSSLRTVNLRVAGDERAECYLTELVGDGGGLTANVDRWRGQMGLGPSSDAEIAALPTVQLLGRDAQLLDVEGVWEGEDDPWRLVGLLAVDSAGSIFLKMTGPADVVAAELESFRALTESLQRGGGAAMAGAAPTGAAAAANGASGFVWEAPEGWNRGPEKTMRLVTYTSGPDNGVECYVTLLGGDGGGARPNIDRWSSQMSATPLDDAEWAALERIQIAGVEGLLVEIPGSYQGMSGPNVPDALLLGAIGELPGRSVFVKLIGPRDAAEAQLDAFRAFCRSLVPEG